MPSTPLGRDKDLVEVDALLERAPSGVADPMENLSKDARASVPIMLIPLTLANSNCL